MKLSHLLLSCFLSFAAVSSAYALEDQCRVVDQDGTMDSWACRNSSGHWHCYADVDYGDGHKHRVWGGCAEGLSDCWWNGSQRVEPCEN